MKTKTKKYKKENSYQVGIISYNMNTLGGNFGAALHSWAFQKYLDKINVSSVIIDYKGFKYHHHLKKREKIFALPFSLYKRRLIRNFFKKNCVITNNTYYKEEIQNLEGIEQYCCETDVTWTQGKNGYNRAFMCDYPNMKSKDNIAYSVDTGSNYPSEENQIKLKEYSKNFKRISLRNIFKIEKIKTIIERPDTVITLDPTLLLEEDDYKPITQNINFKNYVLVYNCKENHSIMVEQAKTFAKKHNLKIKIINCYDKNCKNIFDGVPTLIGIEKFLGLIKNSSAFFTNSYHGICFATIFKKNFFGYSRTANNEKIETILNILGLEERFITDEAQLTLENINYDEVYEKIKPLKEFSKQWINDSIKQP